MSTIRLTITPEMEEVMTQIEEFYRPLTRVEILKLGLAEILNKISQKGVVVSKSNKNNLNLTYDTEKNIYIFKSSPRSTSSKVKFSSPRYRTKTISN